MTIFQTNFRDLVIKSLSDMPLTGVAHMEFDTDFEQLFCTKIEIYNLVESNSLVTIQRRNKDQRYNIIFSEIEDALTLEAASCYASLGQFVFYKATT